METAFHSGHETHSVSGVRGYRAYSNPLFVEWVYTRTTSGATECRQSPLRGLLLVGMIRSDTRNSDARWDWCRLFAWTCWGGVTTLRGTSLCQHSVTPPSGTRQINRPQKQNTKIYFCVDVIKCIEHTTRTTLLHCFLSNCKTLTALRRHRLLMK